MKQILLSVIAIFICTGLGAQNQQDSIQVVKKLWTVYQQNGINLNPKQISDVVSVNPAALVEMKKARTNLAVACVFAGAGGFMIGWSIGAGSQNGEINWPLLGSGAGLFLIGDLFGISNKKHTVEAIRLYNSGIPYARRETTDLRFGMTGSGIGLTITF